MKAYAIVIRNHSISEQAFSRLIESSKNVGNDFTIERFDAIIPDHVDSFMKEYELEWTWPWSGTKYDEKTKIRMHAYGTANPKRRIACALSHFTLWKKCKQQESPFLILEHDSLFIKKLEYDYIVESDYGAIGLNDPRNATRKAGTFHDVVERSQEKLVPCPVIDRMEVAQGIAGNSAYIIKPFAAKELIEKVYEHGMWPNDAIMCQQIVPWLAVTKTYYTKVQGTTSTTSSNI